MKIELIGVDFNKPTFEMVGGMSIDDIRIKYNWFLNAEVENAIIGEDDNGLVWYSGEWICGTWEDGTWYSGNFHDGRWKNGNFYSYDLNQRDMMLGKLTIEQVDINKSHFINGSWEGGVFHYGIFGQVNTEVEIPPNIDLDFILDNNEDYHLLDNNYINLTGIKLNIETLDGINALCILVTNGNKYLTSWLESKGVNTTTVTDDNEFLLMNNVYIKKHYDMVVYDKYVWSVSSELVSKGKELADIGMVVVSSGNDTHNNVFVLDTVPNVGSKIAITFDNTEYILGVPDGTTIASSIDNYRTILKIQSYCKPLYNNNTVQLNESIMGYIYETEKGGSFYHDQMGLPGISSTVIEHTLIYQLNRSYSSVMINSPEFSGGDFNDGWMNAAKIYDGNTNNGYYNNSIRYNGKQYNGIFLGDLWYNGDLLGGDFSNGIWYDGLLSSFVDTVVARFGTDYKDNGATWKNGKFVNGEFHSKLNQSSNGDTLPSLDHDCVHWENGEFTNGKWYGGVFEKGSWISGTFYMGIFGKLSYYEYEKNYDRGVNNDNDEDFNVKWFNGHIYDCLWYSGIFHGGTISGGIFHFIKANNTNFGCDI